MPNTVLQTMGLMAGAIDNLARNKRIRKDPGEGTSTGGARAVSESDSDSPKAKKVKRTYQDPDYDPGEGTSTGGARGASESDTDSPSPKKSKKEKKKRINPKGKFEWPCRKCNKWFRIKANLTSHEAVCAFCEYCENFYDLRHVARCEKMHASGKRRQIKLPRLLCNLCHRLRSGAGMARHMKLEHRIGNWKRREHPEVITEVTDFLRINNLWGVFESNLRFYTFACVSK